MGVRAEKKENRKTPPDLINAENIITSGLDEIFLPFPGMMRTDRGQRLEVHQAG